MREPHVHPVENVLNPTSTSNHDKRLLEITMNIIYTENQLLFEIYELVHCYIFDTLEYHPLLLLLNNPSCFCRICLKQWMLFCIVLNFFFLKRNKFSGVELRVF